MSNEFVCVPQIVRDLQALGKSLESSETNEKFIETLSQILDRFSDRDTVSTFEMQTSGICNSLARGLSGAHEAGWDAFVNMATRTNRVEGDTGMDCPARVLLLKLVAALNNAEGFEMGSVAEGGVSGSIDASSMSRLSAQALRLKFNRVGLASELRDYPNAVMIDPLAPMSAVHDFLYPKVIRSGGSGSAGANSLGGSSKSAVAGSPGASSTSAPPARSSSTRSTRSNGGSPASAGVCTHVNSCFLEHFCVCESQVA